MTTLNAAANTSRSLSLDFSKAAPTAAEPHAFASKLLDAQQGFASDAKPVAAHVETKKPADKPRAADKADEGERIAPAAKHERAKAAKKPKDEDAGDDVDDATTTDAKDDEQKPAAAKTSDDALLAALAAAVTPAVAKAVEKPVDTAEADATKQATDATAVLAAAGVAQANAPVAVDAQPAPTTDAKSKAVAASDAALSKPGDAKLDALTKELKPVDDKNAPLPPEATERHAGGNAQQHSSQHQQTPGDGNAAFAQSADPIATPAVKAGAAKDKTFDDALAKLAVGDAQPTRGATPAPATPVPAEVPLRPEQQFAKDNVDRIVSSVQSQVSGTGDGTMKVRLDPPELGALDVAATMLDGKMSVAFTTSNEQATQLLSHSLNHLKTSLESAGITVDRIEVRQGAATTTSASADRDSTGQQQQGKGFDAPSQQQGEQQRKQMVERLWRKYAYGSDEVDLVA